MNRPIKKYMKNYRQGFKKYFDDLAKRIPAPGGGSAQVVIFSIGISLIEKSIQFSLSEGPVKKSYLQRFSLLRKKAYPIIDQDGRVFEKIVSSKEKNKQQKFIAQSEALFVSLAESADNAFLLAKEVESDIKKSILSDFLIGKHCLKIALIGVILNLEANATMFKRNAQRSVSRFKNLLKKWDKF